MRFYEAMSTIQASPDAVWSALIDGAKWPSWDSGVVSVEQFAQGLKAQVEANA